MIGAIPPDVTALRNELEGRIKERTSHIADANMLVRDLEKKQNRDIEHLQLIDQVIASYQEAAARGGRQPRRAPRPIDRLVMDIIAAEPRGVTLKAIRAKLDEGKDKRDRIARRAVLAVLERHKDELEQQGDLWRPVLKVPSGLALGPEDNSTEQP